MDIINQDITKSNTYQY